MAWTQGRLGEAEESFSSALAIYEELNQRHALAETLNSLGLVQEATGHWDEAAAMYREALSLLQGDGDDYGQAQLLANLGNVLTLQRDYANALTCFESGLAIARALADARLEGQLLTGLAELFMAQGRLEEARETFRQSIQRKEAGGDLRSLKHTWLSLGALYHRLRQPAEATAAYQQALAAARAQGDRRIETHVLINLAKLALIESKHEEVARLLDAARPIAEENRYAEALSDISQLRGDLELLRPDPDYHALLRHYIGALAYAEAFNIPTLHEMVAYLADLIRALAADGQPQSMIQMAADIGQLAAETGLSSTVVETFQALAREIEQAIEPDPTV